VAALQTKKQTNKFISIIFIDMLLNFSNNIYMMWSQYIICYTIFKQNIYVGNMNIICYTICKQHMHCICLMMMIAFITIKNSLVPLIEGLCAQIYLRFEISVVCSHLLLFFFVKEKTC